MISEKPYFSIILPIYNVEKYLDRCVNSILNQQFGDFEVIMVDDGSKDTSPAICDSWAAKDSRIKVIHKKNAGLGMARNSGLERAIGKYVFFIDSDDYILPGLLNAVYKRTIEKEFEVVFYGFSRVDQNGKELSRLVPNVEQDSFFDKDYISNKLLPDFIAKNPHDGSYKSIRVSAWNCCIRRETLEMNGLKFVSERQFISEDLYFYIEFFQKLSKVTFINEAYYCYCQNEGSLTFSYKSDRYERLKQFYQDVTKLADCCEYDGEVQLRLKASFISNVMGCLKMEAGNSRDVGYKEAYKRICIIASDSYLVENINSYPHTYFSKSWRLFTVCIIKKWFRLLYIVLLLQYRTHGV